MISIIVFLIILSILVIIHELGHFLAAKKNDVYVEEFGLGLPPRLYGIKRGETIYSINLLPFGGFVKLLGEEEQELKEKKLPLKFKKRAFVSKKPWQKGLIITAGVIGNFLLGWIIISYLFTQGVPVKTNKVIIEKVVNKSPAWFAGLKPKDIIKSLKVKKPNSPVKKYQLESPQVLIDLVKKYSNQEIRLTIQRNSKEFSVLITPRKNPPKGEGPLGIVITSFIEKKYPWYQAPIFGLIESIKITVITVKELTKALFFFLSGQKTKLEITGPVGIAKITSTAVKFGHNAVIQLLGLLSLNLAIVNILPFPALDGGRLALIVYEAVSKKKVDAKIEKRLNLIGFAILLSLIILVTINDIVKIFQ